LQAGFVVTCVGDNLSYSYIASRNANTLADKVALNVLKYSVKEFKEYSFTIQGSDERQYCSPKVDLPVCSVTRSRYGTYKEYHTSLDNMDFVSSEGFNGAYEVYVKIINILENNCYYELTTFCEPQLGKRGLYPNISTLETARKTNVMMNLLSYADGKNDLIDIANIIGVSADKLIDIAKKLEKYNILVKKDKNASG
jgi:aminopeptidase-like protein